MLVKKLSLITALLFFIISTNKVHSSLKLDNWKTYTSFVDAKDAAFDNNGLLWVGTTGGMFTYNMETKEIREFRNTEGLLSLKISTLSINPNDGSIYIGTSDGFIHILTKNNEWIYLTDIVVAKYPNPEVKKILFYGDYAIIAGGFGVAKYDTKRHVFIETVSRFGNLETNPYINDMKIFDNNIWIACDAGIAKIQINKQIANPRDWELFTRNEGLPDNNIKLLEVFQSTIYAATETKIIKYDGTFSLVKETLNNEEIKAIFVINDKLVYSTFFHVFDMNNLNVGYDTYWHKINTVKKISHNGIEIPIFLYSDFAISYVQNNENIHVLPNTPLSNNFVDMEVDSKGRLWVATRTLDQNNGRGITMFDKDGIWNNMIPKINNKNLDQCLKIKVGNNNDIYVSTWGSGLFKLTEQDTGFAVQLYDTSNSPFTAAIISSSNYIIAGKTEIDNFGNIWTINYGEGNPGPILISADKSGNFNSFFNKTVLNDRQFMDLAIDRWGVKWLASSKFGKGMYYFYENGTPDNPNDDKYGRVSQSTNKDLLDNDQTSLAVDKTGILWIGTSAGLNYIYDTYSAISGDDIYIREESHLRNQFIYDIHVDALNNKWIATNKGVWVLNEDASETLNSEILNSSNSPLIDDEVISITSDPETGLVYFGTKNGLSVAQSNSVVATDKYDIECYPQPFDPIAHKVLFIDGLEENSNVTIMGTDGTFINTLNAKGRVVSWDGKDINGNIVANGVYIVVGSSATTKGGAVGKFAVLRK